MQRDAAQRCPGHNKATGEPCKAYPIKGGTACKRHGGSLPGVKRAAEFRIQRDKAQQEVLKRLKAERASRVDTIGEMDRIAAEAIVWKDVVAEQLFRLTPDQWRYEGKTGEQLHAIVALYERCLSSAANILATNLKLGIVEKKAEIDKNRAILVASVIRAIISRLELTPEQRRAVPRIVQEEMMALSSEIVQGELVA